MPEIFFCVLGALIKMEGSGDNRTIAAYSGYEEETVRRALRQLITAGLVERVQQGIYMISERGKIAQAIQVGRKRRQGRGAVGLWRDFGKASTRRAL